MNIEFVKVEKTMRDYKGKQYPNLVLSYNLGKRVVDWGFSVTSAKKLLKAHDEKWEDFKAHEGEQWSTPVDLFNKGDMFEFSRTKIQVFHHYLDEVKQFIKENSRPQVVVKEPKVEVIEDEDTGDYIKTLLLPCYPNEEGGEGLGAYKLTKKNAEYLFNVNSTSGIHIVDIKNHYATNKDAELVKSCESRDGRKYNVTMSPEQVRCIIKYKEQISNFKDGIDINI